MGFICIRFVIQAQRPLATVIPYMDQPTLWPAAGGGRVHHLWYVVRWQWPEGYVCVEGHVGPEVDTQVVHVGGGQEVSERRHAEAGYRGTSQERVH